MSEERRHRLSPEERHAQLLSLGVNFLAEHPLEDLSIEQLARMAGVSRALVFHYFDSKQGMHRAVVTTARDSLLQATAPRMDLPPHERIDDTLRRFVAFVSEHRGTFLSLVRGVASGDDEVRDVVDESRRISAEHLGEAFTELGFPDTPVIRMTLRAWVSFAEEVFVGLAARGEGADGDRVVEYLRRTLEATVSVARDLSS